MIYAIGAVGTEFIKIGWTKQIGKRLKELDTGCPHELEILATADWPSGAETALHRYLQEHNVKGEWFQFSEKTEQAIKWLMDANGLELLRQALQAELGVCRWLEPVTAKPIVAETPEARRREERKRWWAKYGESVHEGH